MTMFNFIKTVCGVSFDVEIDTDVVILSGNSASGKTFLMRTLMADFSLSGRSFRYFSYTDITSKNMDLVRSDIFDGISKRKRDLLMFDNADLYFDDAMLVESRKYADLVIVSCHMITEYLSSSLSRDLYNIKFSGDSLIVRHYNESFV